MQSINQNFLDDDEYINFYIKDIFGNFFLFGEIHHHASLLEIFDLEEIRDINPFISNES